ncbi:MAG: response regulator transcription factor [Anaerolineae bacterium]|nr:response regulator transcription factor [Anaerolineae bacterium]
MKRIMGGGRYVSSELAEHLAAELTGEAPKAPHEMLSDREFRVLRLIGAGRSVSEIAQELYLSVKTVSTYRTRLLTKMQMKTNADLTRYCIQNHLSSSRAADGRREDRPTACRHRPTRPSARSYGMFSTAPIPR